MMKKNYVWALLASMFMVGCSQNDDLPENPGEDQKVEKELSYIAINVNAAPNVGGRVATDGNFAEGSPVENKVETACFFFFDKVGNAFNVAGYVPTSNSTTPDNDASDSNGEATNWVKYTLTDSGDDVDEGVNNNVERMLDPVLVIETKKSVYPASVVAVLNWEPSDKTQGISLETLRESVLADYKNDGKFIMSNSVYLNATTPVYCTPLSEQNFADEETAAEAHPVDIYVERVAVKANVTANYGTGASSFPVKLENDTPLSITIDGVDTQVYARITNWIFNVNNTKSYLMKNLDGLTETTGFSWNDPTHFRSYWASAYAFAGSTAWNSTTRVYNNTFLWDNFKDAGTADYCLENTDATNFTQVVVKGQLVNSTGDPLNIAQWYGKYYTAAQLLEAVANVVRDRIYVQSSGSTTEIASSHLQLVWAYDKDVAMTKEKERDLYTVKFALKNGVTACKSDGTNFNTGEVDAIFASLSPAKYWNNGTVYYYLPIEHYLTDANGNNKAVIRNHFYDIQVNGVVGLGTPVPAPENDDPIPPVKPEDWETYIAAKINVLAWKTVSNNVTLK